MIIPRDEVIRLGGNDSIIWVVDFFEGNWYHCRACYDDDKSTFYSRLSYGTRFCSSCGSELDWEHLEPDRDDLAALQAKLERESGKSVKVRW